MTRYRTKPVEARDRHWKATTPEGRDRWTGTIDYAAALASGEVIRHPATLDPDDAATYLSVATAPTACAGMSWPCRLFVVEPVGPHQPCKRIPHKVICSALRVIEERPAHEALGPQGEEVAALIERAKRLTSEEIEGPSLALLTRDLISEQHFEALHGPWREVIGDE